MESWYWGQLYNAYNPDQADVNNNGSGDICDNTVLPEVSINIEKTSMNEYNDSSKVRLSIIRYGIMIFRLSYQHLDCRF